MTPLNIDRRSGYGDKAAASTERPRARQWIVACVGLAASLASGCASTGAVPRPFPQPQTDRILNAPAVPEVADAPSVALPDPAEASGWHSVLETALALLGSPYRDGGASPDGFDCSGFTQWVFAQHGVALPRETRDQFTMGAAVASGVVSSGDLLFFSTVAPGPSHVGIALDDDRFVHAPSARGVVRVERLSMSYWQQRFIGARRIERATN